MEMARKTESRPQHETSRMHRTLSAGAAALQEQAGYVNLRVQAFEAARVKLIDTSRQKLIPESPTLVDQLIVQVDEALAGWMGFASARYDDHNASIPIRKTNRAGQEGEGESGKCRRK
ncbi:hypothetical protein HYQ45_004585 [Verticillium longisporum]|uniref:Uncharacterized protein n=2 Tax=Verticillium TaxID=1036719 RepID=A0A2J8FP07_VERDA|nr:AhpC/TSA family protein [Verticillium dahliae VDG2]KAF3359547.1 3-hydroxyisobutyryl-CoA hydrolase [Verticillium dahliae VDG1]KAG7138341.1 hypothetical protein HYQ45_004585 [Verticillium longisporum]KAH6685583.1 hypothetical protein EV126DRAFT_404382 [Verticillium dahliae]PNH28836.1 hypothetical protein BJF96_g7928 [Verticillium dahliae]